MPKSYSWNAAGAALSGHRLSLVELAHLAISAPTQIAVPGLSEISARQKVQDRLRHCAIIVAHGDYDACRAHLGSVTSLPSTGLGTAEALCGCFAVLLQGGVDRNEKPLLAAGLRQGFGGTSTAPSRIVRTEDGMSPRTVMKTMAGC
jgi:hypothetical protein